MTIDPERALAAALLGALRADPPLDEVLGPRIWDEPPERPGYPYLLVGRSQTKPYGEDAAEGLEHQVTVTVVSRFGGTEEAHRLVAAVAERLHDAPLALTDHRLVSLQARFRDVFRAADWRSVYGVVRLRAVTEPSS